MIQLSTIKKLNKYAAIAHFLQGLFIVLFFYVIKKGDASFDTDLYSYKALEYRRGQSVYETEKVLSISTDNLKIIIVLIFAITFSFHLFYYKSDTYEYYLRKGYNPYRWIEYGITSTMMTFVLAIISGTKDFDTMVLLVVLNVVMISMGYYGEVYESARTLSNLIGWTCLTAIFFVILRNLFERIDDGQKAGKDIPSWVKFVLFPMAVFYASFGVVAFLLRGKENTMKREFWYIILSFTSKSFMGNWLAYGLTRDERPYDKI